MTVKANKLTNRKGAKLIRIDEGKTILRKLILSAHGFSLHKLARRLHSSPSFVSQLISGKKRSQAKELAISRILKVKPEVLW